MIILNMIEWGSMFDALQIYVECGVTFSASRLLAMEYSNTLGYLMKKGYDPTIELCQRELGYDFWGSRGRLFRLIFVSCYTIDPYTWHYLSKFMDHDENVNGGGLLEYNTNNKELRELETVPSRMFKAPWSLEHARNLELAACNELNSLIFFVISSVVVLMSSILSWRSDCRKNIVSVLSHVYHSRNPHRMIQGSSWVLHLPQSVNFGRSMNSLFFATWART